MKGKDHLDGGRVQMTCQCPGREGRPGCGYTEEYDSEQAAFEAGWDGVGVVSSWPVSCPLCPGVASLGMVDHSEAHVKWLSEGRPEGFTAQGIKEL